MSTGSIILLIIAGLLAALVFIPRIIMSLKAAKLKGKPAPTPHKASAKRITSGKKTVLYFFTPPCGACKIQEPIIGQVRRKHRDAIFKIDASRESAAASAYGVLGVPFLVFIENGIVLSARAGVQQAAAFETFFAN
ncbi:thioredoxin family protein [bacterium]|nr:thioredoxin family protein [bacterium]